MPDIQSLIRDAMGLPELTLVTGVDPSGTHRSTIRSVLSAKHLRKIEKDRAESFFTHLGDPLTPAYRAFFDSITEADKPERDYSNLKDFYGIAEYYGSQNYFQVTPDYLKFIKNSTDGFYVNSYTASSHGNTDRDGRADNHINRQIRKFRKQENSNVKFVKPDEINYSRIGNSIYSDNLKIEASPTGFPVLAIDVPLSLYRYQNSYSNTYFWDIDTEEFRVCNIGLDEINKRIQALAKDGIKEPLVVRIENGIFYPLDDETKITMLLATYLALPTIPVIIYMTNENALIDEDARDLIQMTKRQDKLLDTANYHLYPYFLFKESGDTASTIKVRGNKAYLSQYKGVTLPYRDRDNISNLYFDPNAPEPKVVIDDDNFEEEDRKYHEKMRTELLDKMAKEAEEVCKNIIDGVYMEEYYASLPEETKN
jgi:hypothetical protein